MKTRTRRLAGLAVGAGFVVAPFALATPAGASTNVSQSHASLTFVNYDGVTVSCTLFHTAIHNTDDPARSYTVVSTALSGPSDCSNLAVATTISYKDKGGVAQTATNNGDSVSETLIPGTHPAISTSVSVHWLNCNEALNPTCDTSTIANPK